MRPKRHRDTIRWEWTPELQVMLHWSWRSRVGPCAGQGSPFRDRSGHERIRHVPGCIICSKYFLPSSTRPFSGTSLLEEWISYSTDVNLGHMVCFSQWTVSRSDMPCLNGNFLSAIEWICFAPSLCHKAGMFQTYFFSLSSRSWTWSRASEKNESYHLSF